MSESQAIPAQIPITHISAEDLYNYLYWDHRIYDVREETQYHAGHICRAHHMDARSMLSIDAIASIDRQINDEYGRTEHPERVIIYTELDWDVPDSLVAYLNSSSNPSHRALKFIHILTGGYEQFQRVFPFLCSDSPHYQVCSEMTWPSFIIPSLFLGSSICRNETVIDLLNVTHVLSLSAVSYTHLTLPTKRIV